MNRNRYLEALKENFNVVGLSTAVALSAATLSPLPLLVGLVAEAVYLVFVPDTKWYEARLSKRYDDDVVRRREELKARILPTLRPEMQERFYRLEEVRVQLGAESRDDRPWFQEVLRKLDFLLEKFLQFAGKEEQFRAYLHSVVKEVREEAGKLSKSQGSNYVRRQQARGNQPAANAAPPNPTAALSPEDRRMQQSVEEVQTHYDREIAAIRALMEQDKDSNTRAVLERRCDVLQRRREFIGKIGRITINLNHQLLLLEDTFGLINDEIRARPPEQILADIDEVVWQTKSMTELLEEFSSNDKMFDPVSI